MWIPERSLYHSLTFSLAISLALLLSHSLFHSLSRSLSALSFFRSPTLDPYMRTSLPGLITSASRVRSCNRTIWDDIYIWLMMTTIIITTMFLNPFSYAIHFFFCTFFYNCNYMFPMYFSYVFDAECESDVKNSIKLKTTPKMEWKWGKLSTLF